MNFRNYESLELDLDPGMVLVEGGNAQGKSNLLEALYILAIAKSTRATADRELVRWQATPEPAYARVAALVLRDGGRTRVQVDLLAGGPKEDSQAAEQSDSDARSVQKQVKVNGIPRRASDLVGEVNAVMFSAQDLDLVLGSPSVRRRYLDILISQLDRHYLRALQRYQGVLSQRNHLLKSVRYGRSAPGEMDFWDDELVASGSQIMSRRAEAVTKLSQKSGPLHLALTGNREVLELVYRPSFEVGVGGTADQIGASLRAAIEMHHAREVAQGFTVVGPHRDDLQMLLDGRDAGLYASRGQCRTTVLAMKLAEASYLKERRGQEPILLLDDVLSELDASRRSHVLEQVSPYQQCFITTTDQEQITETYRAKMSRFVVRDGRVEPFGI